MKSIRIGTRKSPLALWQAREVARHLQNLNYTTEMLTIESQGDKNLTQPLYSLGVTGVFTKDLDIALLDNQIDIAVHSLKDIPTIPAKGIITAGVLERDFPWDILVRSAASQNIPLEELSIATSSLRRKAFWRKKFPSTQFSDIRGNVQTRLDKLNQGLADATLFSQAAMDRMKMNVSYEVLDFMLPAPGQGVVGITVREGDAEHLEIIQKFSCQKTWQCTYIEREFLRVLEGGCTAPIGAFVKFIEDSTLEFKGQLTSIDGKDSIELTEIFPASAWKNAGQRFAEKMKDMGGAALMETIKSQL